MFDGLMLKAKEIRTPPEVSKRLLRGCRVDKPAHGGDAIGRKTYASGMFLDGRLVWRKIDAVHLVAGYVAMEPLDLRTHPLQNVGRLLGDFTQLAVGYISGSRDFAFDDELGHGSPRCPQMLACR